MKKKYFIWSGAVLGIMLLGAAGFYFLSGKNKNVPSAAETAVSTVPASPKVLSFKGSLAQVLSEIGNKVADIVSPPSSPAPPSPFSDRTNNSTNDQNQNSFSFAVIGDTKVFSANNPNGNLEKAVKSIEKQNPNFAFAMGDLISSCDGTNSCDNKFIDWKRVMGDLLAKTYEVVGNHDYIARSGADDIWRKEFNLPTNGPSGFSEQVYSFDFGNSHFVVLDSEKPDLSIVNDVQRAWLERDLTANKKENVFVFYHEPAYQVAQKSNDGLDAHASERDALWNILKKYNVKYVFNGHAHLFSEKKIGNIYQIVEGDTDSTDDDFPLAGFADYAYKGKAYSMVQVDGTKVTLNLYSVDGNLIKTIDLI